MTRLSLSFAIPLVLILAGCTSPALNSSPSSAPASSTPSPQELDIAQAGERYLEIVCPSNDDLDAFNAVFTNPESTIEEIKAAAVPLAESTRLAAEKFDDPMLKWPDVVAKDIVVIRDSYFSDLSTLDTIQGVATAQEAFGVTFDNNEAIGESSQRIRSRLDLPADTLASCDDFD